MAKTTDREALILMHLKEGASISEISRRITLSRQIVRKIIKEKFPQEYKKILKKAAEQTGPKLEVEIGKLEDSKETIDFYKELGYRFFGETDYRGDRVLLFSPLK